MSNINVMILGSKGIPVQPVRDGMPYLFRFAFAEFSGELDSMHRQEGFDCDAMSYAEHMLKVSMKRNSP